MIFKYTWMFNDHYLGIHKFPVNDHLYMAAVYQLSDAVVDFLLDAEIIMSHLHESCTESTLFIELYFLDGILMTDPVQSEICYDDDIKMSVSACFHFSFHPQRFRYRVCTFGLIEWVRQCESVHMTMEPSVHFRIFFSNAHQKSFITEG